MKAVALAFKSFFLQGQARTIRIKKSIVGLTLLKGLSMAVGVMLVPLTLHYLDPFKYGIWLTLSSVIGWLSYFDIGLSNGLRNKLGEALAQGDTTQARTFVSTTLAMLTMIVALVSLMFLIVNPFLDWTAILNAPGTMTSEINLLVIVVFVFFALRFISGLISTVLMTDQRPALADSLNAMGGLLSLAVIYILILITKNSLLYVGASLSAATTLVPIIASLWFFSRRYRAISPSIHYVDFSKVKSLTGQGLQFFGIQIAALVLFTTGNVVIAQLFGPAEVVPYNVAYKLFGYVIVVFGILVTPFWAAYNEAYNKQDFHWIKRATKKMLAIWGVTSIGVLLLFASSGFVYHLWIGDQITVPVSLSFFTAVFVIIHTFNMIFVTFIFATGKLRIQSYLAIGAAIIFIPLSILFAKSFGLGPSGVILATTACGILNFVFGPMQYHKLIHGHAKGIWAK